MERERERERGGGVRYPTVPLCLDISNMLETHTHRRALKYSSSSGGGMKGGGRGEGGGNRLRALCRSGKAEMARSEKTKCLRWNRRWEEASAGKRARVGESEEETQRSASRLKLFAGRIVLKQTLQQLKRCRD